MAAFSFQHYNHNPSSFFINSSSPLFFPSPTNNINNIIMNNNNNNNSKINSGYLEEFPNTNTNTNPCFPINDHHQLYDQAPPPLVAYDNLHHPLQEEVSSLNISSSSTTNISISCLSNNSSSSMDPQSTTDDQNIIMKKKKQITTTPMDHLIHNKRKYNNLSSKYASSLNSSQSKDTAEAVEKNKKQRKSRGASVKKADDHKEVQKTEEKEDVAAAAPTPAPAPTGYIHVRARRGQATDSHSLAERVRREKISERMRVLQAIVPGCDKVTGKALMLDEIINYVQSLQNQVEFLSMKLASLNPMLYDFGADMDSFMVKPERMGGMGATQQPDMQECSPNKSTTNNLTTANNNYPLIDSSNLLLLQQGQMPNILSQNVGQVIWDADEHRQKVIAQSGFINNLCSFH